MTDTLTPPASLYPRRSLRSLLETPGTRTVTVAMSKDPNAKVSILVVPPGRQTPQFVVKIPTTDQAAAAVERESRMLVEMRRMVLGPIHATIPRFVQVCEHEGRTVLVASAVPGVPLARAYNSWPHTSRRSSVAADFASADDWLARFQTASSGPAVAPVDLLSGTADLVRDLARRGATCDRPVAARVAERVDGVHRMLSSFSTPRTAVHGDFWFGNLLVDGPGRVTGVVDWEHASPRGEPLRDLGRFAVSYSLYLDRHTPAGRRVSGHRQLRADHVCAGVTYGLTGIGWYPRLVRSFLVAGLARLGLPETLWYAVGWAAVADVVAGADDHEFAWRHVRLLDVLPPPSTAQVAL